MEEVHLIEIATVFHVGIHPFNNISNYMCGNNLRAATISVLLVIVPVQYKILILFKLLTFGKLIVYVSKRLKKKFTLLFNNLDMYSLYSIGHICCLSMCSSKLHRLIWNRLPVISVVLS